MSIDSFRAAVQDGDIESVKNEIELNGIDPNTDLTTGKLGWFSNFTPTIWKGLHKDSRDSLGYQALHWAARNNHPEIVKYLVSKGANLNSGNIIGNTPLHVAIFYGSTSAVRALLKAGADPNIKNSGHAVVRWEYLAPLHYAVIYGNDEILSILLKTNNIEIDIQNNFGLSSVHLAVMAQALGMENQLAHLNILLDNNCSAEIVDKNGRTPLYYALENSKLGPEISERLLKTNPNIYKMDKYKKPVFSALINYVGDDVENQIKKVMLFISKYSNNDLSKFVSCFVSECIAYQEHGLLTNLFFALTNDIKLRETEKVTPVVSQLIQAVSNSKVSNETVVTESTRANLDNVYTAQKKAGTGSTSIIIQSAEVTSSAGLSSGFLSANSPPPPPPPPIKLAPIPAGLVIKRKENSNVPKKQEEKDPSDKLMTDLFKKIQARRDAMEGKKPNTVEDHDSDYEFKA